MTDLRTLQERDARYNTSYSDPKLRQPQNLPLPEVELDIVLVPEDLEEGKPWPPERASERVRRMRMQYEVSKGNYQYFFPFTDNVDAVLSFNPVGSYIEVMQALLLSSVPGPGESPEIRKSLQRNLERMIQNMIRHGRGILLGDADMLLCMDTPLAYQILTADGLGWVFAEPRISAAAKYAQPDVLDISLWTERGFTIETRSFESRGGRAYLGAVVESPGAPEISDSVRLAIADRSPLEGDRGTSQVDDLAPVALEMARRNKGISYTLDANERPIFQVRQKTADSAALDGAYAQNERPLTPDEVRKLAPTLRLHDVLVLPDGSEPGAYATWDSSMTASFEFLERLDREWHRATGLAPAEAGDSGNLSSGVAIARRNAQLMIRARQLHGAVYDAAVEALGREFEWDFIEMDTEVTETEAPTPDEGQEPEGGDSANPDVEPEGV